MNSIRLAVSLFLISLVTIPSLIFSCRHDADISEITEVCFEGDVLPVFKNSCAMAGCHNGSGETDLILDSYINISNAVTPGKPYSSAVYKAIIATAGENKMPPGQPLSLENRTLIRIWIEQGAKLTVCPDTSNGGGSYVNPRACFARDILPVLVSRCGTAGCHDAVTRQDGYDFTSYSTTISAVRPGNPDGSDLYEAITDNDPEDRMPPAGKPQLTLAEIDSIGKWIIYGALNENCGELCDTINPVTFSGVIWPVVQSTCTGCHSGSSPSGNILLTSYASISAVASNGILIKALNGDGVPKMPPSGTISACKKRQFEIWVNNGFQNN